MSIEFKIHPSKELNTIFRKKPYQGACPEESKVVFVSSDANYSPEISNSDFFKYILEYQNNGVQFWKDYGQHHPFLINQYPFNKTQNGRPFHNNFKKIGLDSSYAENISFIELLDIPTIGNKSQNKKLFYSYVNPDHLKRLDSLLTQSGGRLVYITKGVIEDMVYLKKQHDVFNWLPDSLGSKKLKISVKDNEMREIYHFSSSHIHREVGGIKKQIDEWLKNF